MLHRIFIKRFHDPRQFVVRSTDGGYIGAGEISKSSFDVVASKALQF